MSDEKETFGDAIDALQGAFAEDASVEAMKKGEQVLGGMLAALRGAMAAKEPAAKADEVPSATPSASTTAEASKPAKPPKPNKPPDLIEMVVSFLKTKLSDEDREAIESQAPPFSVPFIRM